MEDTLQVGTRPFLWQKKPHQFLSQFMISSKSSKAEGYKTFGDEIMNTLKGYPGLVGDERLGRAITRVSRVGGS